MSKGPGASFSASDLVLIQEALINHLRSLDNNVSQLYIDSIRKTIYKIETCLEDEGDEGSYVALEVDNE